MVGDLQKLVNELADELLRWIEWLLVPLAMLWLTLFWPFLDPKKLKCEQQAASDEIKTEERRSDVIHDIFTEPQISGPTFLTRSITHLCPTPV